MSAKVAAPYAPVNRVASVTPICTADRNRFGSWASFAARWPRLPRRESLRIWPSRSETRAISAPAKNPPMRMMTRMMTISPMSLLTTIPGFSECLADWPAGTGHCVRPV